MFRAPQVKVLAKDLPIYKRGDGAIPLLIVGPASLFRKPKMLPPLMDKYFTIYFVDLFEKQSEKSADYSALKLDDFVELIENIRAQLGLSKMALFGHSATGVLAMEYTKKYKSNVLFNIIVSTAAIWGDDKKKLTDDFFDLNSTDARKDLYKKDQKNIAENKETKSEALSSLFVRRYHARRAHFYHDPTDESWQHLWDDVKMDEALVNQYFETMKNYDFRSSCYQDISTFLALGLHDYSAPFYAWTDEVKAISDNVEYCIFEESGHYPMREQADIFMKKLLQFIDKIMGKNGVRLAQLHFQHNT